MGGRILVVRHGETDANRTECFAASDEIRLTEVGRRQALQVARRLEAEFRPRHLLSSPFARARETSEIIAGVLAMEIEILDGIHERDFGCLKGHPYARMFEMMAGDPAYDCNTPWTWSPPGGESLEDVRRRVVAVLAGVRGRSGDVVVVCHGAVMQALAAHVSGSWNEVSIPGNCGILVIE
jgi:broad specificity phosphatase PhoE